MRQSTLFGEHDEDTPLARASDPPTSHMAAEDIEHKLSGLRAEALLRATALCQKYGDATANEIAYNWIDSSIVESLRKRVHELKRDGLLVLHATRRCRITGKSCQTYRTLSGP